MTVRYVDLLLSGTTATYSIANRDDSGSDGPGYATIQAAADVVDPGDTVLIRGGTYTMAGKTQNTVSRSGFATLPITFEGYSDESVIIQGIASDTWDQDLNADGDADGPADTSDRTALLDLNGSYLVVRRLTVERAPWYGLRVNGAGVVLEEVTVRHSWMTNMLIEGPGTTLRWCETHHSRHGSGLAISPKGASTSTPLVPINTTVYRCLCYRNGYDAADTQVLPIGGDPQGGGNSDGLAVLKDCIDVLFGACTGEFFRELISWHNTDDGIDCSFTNSTIVGCVSLFNGPEGNRGIKQLRRATGNRYLSNVAVGNYIGFEPRSLDGFDGLHNLALSNASHGFSSNNAGAAARYYNNVTYLNGGTAIFSGGTALHNWVDTAGDPGLTDAAAVIDYTLPAGSVATRWQYLMDQIVAAYTPANDSPLRNSGQWLAGYHCATADDDPMSPMNPTAPGRHWVGLAPDIGPFEYGIVGCPDRTGLASPPVGSLRVRHPIPEGAW